MAKMSPDKLILRCYGHKIKQEKWFGVCLEFNLAAEADSPEELKKKLADMITSYIETILDTDDKISIPVLISRRAPIRNWLMYYFIRLIIFIRKFPDNFTFKEIIPFHLAHSC